MEPNEPIQQKVGSVPKFKVVFLGNQSVGKTSIIHRYIYNTFSSDYSVFLPISSLISLEGDYWD